MPETTESKKPQGTEKPKKSIQKRKRADKEEVITYDDFDCKELNQKCIKQAIRNMRERRTLPQSITKRNEFNLREIPKEFLSNLMDECVAVKAKMAEEKEKEKSKSEKSK